VGPVQELKLTDKRYNGYKEAQRKKRKRKRARKTLKVRTYYQEG